MYLYPKKTFILNTFWPPSGATYILKNLKIDAGSEPEILIKSIQNYSIKNNSFLSIYLMLILSCDAVSILENLRIYACICLTSKK